jgi:hypothetical protein
VAGLDRCPSDEAGPLFFRTSRGRANPTALNIFSDSRQDSGRIATSSTRSPRPYSLTRNYRLPFEPLITAQNTAVMMPPMIHSGDPGCGKVTEFLAAHLELF